MERFNFSVNINIPGSVERYERFLLKVREKGFEIDDKNNVYYSKDQEQTLREIADQILR